MQKAIFCKLLLLLIAVLCTVSKADTLAMNEPELQPTEKKKALIVWLSRTKNTEAVAQLIHQEVGGKLVSVELVTPYPEDYRQIVDQVDHENDIDFLPQLKTNIANIRQYDAIFVGFPTWDMELPPPIKSFLAQYDLHDKLVIPFNTNAGYGVGKSFNQVKQFCRDCNVLKGIQLKGGKEKDGIFFVMQGETAVRAKEQIHQWLVGLSKNNAVIQQLLLHHSAD